MSRHFLYGGDAKIRGVRVLYALESYDASHRRVRNSDPIIPGRDRVPATPNKMRSRGRAATVAALVSFCFSRSAYWLPTR